MSSLRSGLLDTETPKALWQPILLLYVNLTCWSTWHISQLPYYLSKYILTRNLGRYAPKFLAPAEVWWPSATDWQGLFIFFLGGGVKFYFFFRSKKLFGGLFFLVFLGWKYFWGEGYSFIFFIFLGRIFFLFFSGKKNFWGVIFFSFFRSTNFFWGGLKTFCFF